MSRNLLIMHASVGAGHARAAEALELAAREMLPEAKVKCVDILELSNRVFRRLYGKSYIDLVNKAPHLLGYLYDRLDYQAPGGNGKQPGSKDRIRFFFQQLNLSKFKKLLFSEPWDLILNTHFLPAEVIAHYKRKGELSAPQVTITTDFDTHRLWANQPCEHYYTASEDGLHYLRYWGIPVEHMTVTGIPIHPDFSKPKDRAALLEKYHLRDDKPIVLHMSGGDGVGPMKHVYRAILAVEQPLQLITLTGRNDKLQRKLSKIEVPARHHTHVMGFTREIDELMHLADVVVSKPGGLTTSETLASGAAMLIFNPTPGQEMRNSDFLLEHSAARKVNNLGTLTYKLGSMLADRDTLETLKANARRLGRPRAAYQILEHASRFVGEGELIGSSPK